LCAWLGGTEVLRGYTEERVGVGETPLRIPRPTETTMTAWGGDADSLLAASANLTWRVIPKQAGPVRTVIVAQCLGLCSERKRIGMKSRRMRLRREEPCVKVSDLWLSLGRSEPLTAHLRRLGSLHSPLTTLYPSKVVFRSWEMRVLDSFAHRQLHISRDSSGFL
jgi:hypothetical protein